MLALLLLGAVLASHLPTGWKDARYKRTGIGILAVAAWLMISGHLLYYSGDEAVRQAASYSHLGVGLAYPLLPRLPRLAHSLTMWPGLRPLPVQHGMAGRRNPATRLRL